MYWVGIRVADFKSEIGRGNEGEYQRQILSDEITPVTCPLWDLKTGKKLDKQVFRRDFGSFTDAYAEVPRRLCVFPENPAPISKPT